MEREREKEKEQEMVKPGNFKVPSAKIQKDTRLKRIESCCEDCKILTKRITKLEKELQRIENKVHLYPIKHKKSFKNCLERIKGTSETMLTRLSSWSRFTGGCGSGKSGGGAGGGGGGGAAAPSSSKKVDKKEKVPSRRTASAPETVLQKEMFRVLSVRKSESNCDLNVGMEIRMENVDPVTGKKLFPEVNPKTKQEGNIQCRLYKNNDAPVMIMDTDFSYNPVSGTMKKITNLFLEGGISILKNFSHFFPSQVCYLKKGRVINWKKEANPLKVIIIRIQRKN